ncbi:MAG: metal ABC transporter substrate-binding protein [Peptoniphilus sp.]|nr:metal ABC transporter substrate-binding protein [Peptoniphilus sp.]MDD7363494.1 metal ABC transporter substrate-binding protein [Bacillota bacterium]MDY6044802.1 metal ABC transporter substrate-binding protein [Peptoniphilus sp.]
MKIQKIATITCALALLTACGSGQNAKTNNATDHAQTTQEASVEKNADKKAEGLNVVTSTYFLKDLAEEIAGEGATVTCLIPKDSGIHDYEPSPKDMNLLNEADVFIYSGAGLESWVDTVKGSMEGDAEAVEASKGIELIAGGGHHHHDGEEAHHDSEEAHHDSEEAHHHDHGGKDPHVWMSPKNAEQMAKNIADALIAKDPDNKDLYEKNLEKLEGELGDLDQSFRDALDQAKNKDIVVSHEAYGYLAKEYGLNQIPIEGINSETEPDPKAMKEIIDAMKAKDIKVVFTEPKEDDKIAQTVASETGAEVKELDPLEYESDQTYLQRMEQNLKVLETALK